RYETKLREYAAAPGIGWGYVAEKLEAAGWSLHWDAPRRLTAELLAREMAVIAFRGRKRAGVGTSDRRLVRALEHVMAPVHEKLDALRQSGGITPAAAAELQSVIATRVPAPTPTTTPPNRTREITAPAPPSKLILKDEPVESEPVLKINFDVITKNLNSNGIGKKGDAN
ncbi:MAG: hypothetical protein ING69_10490, partial [Rhodocyclaceae bacterium]|nr:hypothetical protein [Rhodocyclaceae bacterium]